MKPEIEEIEHRNESSEVTNYTGIVRFETVATGGEKAFSGSGPSKSAAHENAAQTAVNKIHKHSLSGDCEDSFWCCEKVCTLMCSFIWNSHYVLLIQLFSCVRLLCGFLCIH